VPLPDRMSARPTCRVPRTATRRRRVGTASPPASAAAALTNTTLTSGGAAPEPANCGPSTSGSAVSTVAFGSPTAPQAGSPALSTSCGLAPNSAGRHSTTSASLPTSSEPTSWAMPWVIAGLMVSFAR